MRRFLVTGTDTGVGKTFVGCALAAALANTRRVGVLKPAETGCAREGDSLVPDDARRLRVAARSSLPLEVICPFRYEEPLAPAVAARRAGRPIDLAIVRESFDRIAHDSDVMLVEGAGGLLVPLHERYGFADLAEEIDLEVLVVVGSRLGALNQALLTIEVVRGRGLPFAGYVLNEVSAETDLAHRTNEEALAALTDAPCLASLSFVPEAPPAAVGKPIARALGLLRD